MRYLVFIILLAPSLWSCQEPRPSLIGNWGFEYFIDSSRYEVDSIITANYHVSSDQILAFISDSVVDTKIPLYKEGEFLGTERKYKVEGNKIIVDNGPVFSIDKLTTDSLVLKDQWRHRVYKRFNLGSDTTAIADQIIFTGKLCGDYRCPSRAIMIQSNGQVFYSKDDQGVEYFIGKLPAGKFEELENKFGRTRFLRLDRNYTSGVTDQATTSITFLKDNKIIKSIEDYGNSAPYNVQWNYSSMLYLPDQLELTRLEPLHLPFANDISYFIFLQGSGKTAWSLSDSEQFLLFNYLVTAKVVEAISTTNLGYRLEYTPYEFKTRTTILTDGRIYQLQNGDNAPVTLDIGFNFLIENREFVEFKDL